MLVIFLIDFSENKKINILELFKYFDNCYKKIHLYTRCTVTFCDRTLFELGFSIDTYDQNVLQKNLHQILINKIFNPEGVWLRLAL